jgi:DNA-binding GntR family transcriptional regulator
MTGRVAGRLDRAAVEHFEQLVTAGFEAAEASELASFLDLDRSFHLGLLRHAGNEHVVNAVDRVLDQLRLAIFRQSSHGATLADVADGHREILDAIVADDRARTERAVREHLPLTRSAWHAAPRASECDAV